MGFGGDIETVNNVYVQAVNEKTGKIVYLTGINEGAGWPSDPSWFMYYYLGGQKTINGQDTVTVGRTGAMGNGDVGLFLVPDLDNSRKYSRIDLRKEL